MESISGVRCGGHLVSTLQGVLREVETYPKTDDSSVRFCVAISLRGATLATFVVKENDAGIPILKKLVGKRVYCVFVATRKGNFLYAFFLEPSMQVVNLLNCSVAEGTFSDVVLQEKDPTYMSKARFF